MFKKVNNSSIDHAEKTNMFDVLLNFGSDLLLCKLHNLLLTGPTTELPDIDMQLIVIGETKLPRKYFRFIATPIKNNKTVHILQAVE